MVTEGTKILNESQVPHPGPLLGWVKVTQSCPTLCDPMDYTVHGILQARILQWGAFPSSRGSSQPRDWTQVPYIAGGFFTSWANWNPLGGNHTQSHDHTVPRSSFFNIYLIYSLGCVRSQLWVQDLVASSGLSCCLAQTLCCAVRAQPVQHVGSLLSDQGSNPCPLHCKADSSPLDYQGSPASIIFSFVLGHG